MTQVVYDGNFGPPHALCPDCSHFAANHEGYPGRKSSSRECTVMSMSPISVGRDEIVKCTCERKAISIK